MAPESIGGLNLYAYCGSNPIMRWDPSGNAWWHWAIGAGIVIGLAALTVISAGGFAAAGLALLSASSGLAVSSTLTTVLAFATVGAATVFGAYALGTGLTALSSMAMGTSPSEALSTAMDYGEEAMWATIGGGAAGALTGYISNKLQYPKIKHSWTTEQRQYWGGNAPIGSDGKSIELHHPYGRTGRNFYLYYPMERTDHVKLTSFEAWLYGGKGVHPTGPYINVWDIIKAILNY